ncbi:MAG: polymer-forming cytoskeletal protein [Bacteroidota bacterium]
MALFGSKSTDKKNDSSAFKPAPSSSLQPSNRSNRTRTPSAPSAPAQINMVGQGAAIEGTLSVKGDVRIGGHVKGEVRVDGKLVVTGEGLVEGVVHATEADIAGRIKGDIIASERLVLRKSGNVEGNITSGKLVIEDGAVFVGQVKMSSSSSSNTKKSPVTTLK